MENNNYIVSARKYRPSTFSTVVGQKNLTATLKNAIVTDRLAHSYLFCGSRGVGKTSCARIFAKTINCEHRTPDGDPCNECESCRSFNEGRSFNIIEMDAASNNGVDDMRRLTEQVLVPPTNGRYRVFIIDEVHMLSSAAFNAFLKTLEEPPSYIIFILATTEKQKIIPTILSRCQIYDFNRITVNDIVEHLESVAQKEGVKAERKALSVIATQADGAMRDALSIFDQIVASSRGNITYQSVIDNLNILDNKYFLRLSDAFVRNDVADALLVFKEIRDKGFNTHFFIKGLNAFIRDLMMARDERTLSILDVTEEEKSQLVETAARFTPEFFYMALSLINDADLKYRDASNKIFLTELLLIKLCQLLSPSPVFSGKEEGHLDNLKPLGSMRPSAAPTPQKQENAHVVQEPSQDYKPVSIPAPTATPHPGTTAAGVPKHTPKTVTHSTMRVISLKDSKSQTATANSTNEHHAAFITDRNFTDNELQEAWNAYMNSVPEKKLLVNLMHSCKPHRSENEGLLRIVLENELQKDLLQSEKPELLRFLREKLGNHKIDIDTEIVESADKPELWTEREVLENMIQSNPEMGKFIEDLGLTLS